MSMAQSDVITFLAVEAVGAGTLSIFLLAFVLFS
jgi:hypothetical protein